MLEAGQRLAVLALAITMAAVPVRAQWQTNGVTRVDPSLAATGDFGVQLLLTDDWQGFQQGWNQSTPGFAASDVHKIAKGKPLTTAIIFTGCAADSSGNCHVTGDFLVIDPKGKTYAERRGVNIWNLPPPPGHNLQLSIESLGLVLDQPDPLGVYKVVASVTDLVSGKTLETRTTFVAEPPSNISY